MPSSRNNPSSNRPPGRRPRVAGLRKPGESDQPSPTPRGESEGQAGDTPLEQERTARQPIEAETPNEPVAEEQPDSAEEVTTEEETDGTEHAAAASDAELTESDSGGSSSGPRRKRRSKGSEKPVVGDAVVGAAAPGTSPARLVKAKGSGARGRFSTKSTYIVAGGLVVVAAVFSTGAWFAGSKYSDVSDATGNAALINVDETQQAKKEMSKAAERLFSFDYRDIDKTERAAKDLLGNSEVKHKYDTLMEEVKRLAPEQKAVVSVDATESAVVNLHDDQAKVMVYVDQTSKRKKSEKTASGGAALWLTGELHDGDWKVVGMDTYSSGESDAAQQGKDKQGDQGKEKQSKKKEGKDKKDEKDEDKKDKKESDDSDSEDSSSSSGN